MKKITFNLLAFFIALLLLTACHSTTGAQEGSSVKENETSNSINSISEDSSSKPDSTEANNDITYVYLFDKWNLYKATMLSKSTMKIERWYRSNAGEEGDAFAYKQDVSVFNIEEASTDFSWVDDQHTAFTITMKDESNRSWTEDKIAGFSLEAKVKDSKGLSCYEPEFSFMHDKWHIYYAVPISGDVYKIECWSRSDAALDGDYFSYEYDFGVWNISYESDVFWLDESHNAFRTTMKDDDNYEWEESETVDFTPVTEEYTTEAIVRVGEYGSYTYTNDKWHLYIASQVSDTIIKIECWSRNDAGEDGDPFKPDHDVCALVIGDEQTDFRWTDDEHVAFSVTMVDFRNKFYWKEESLVSYTIEQEETIKQRFDNLIRTTFESATEWYNEASNMICKGVYFIGSDMSAGEYELQYFKSNYNFEIILFSSVDDYYNYFQSDRWSVGEVSDAIKQYASDHKYLEYGESIDLSLSDGDVLVIEDGIGVINNKNGADNKELVVGEIETIPEGTYVVGKDIDNGSYMLTLCKGRYSSRIILFETEEQAQKFIDDDPFTLGEYQDAIEEYALYSTYISLFEQGCVNLREGMVLMTEDELIAQKVEMSWTQKGQ